MHTDSRQNIAMCDFIPDKSLHLIVAIVHRWNELKHAMICDFICLNLDHVKFEETTQTHFQLTSVSLYQVK